MNFTARIPNISLVTTNGYIKKNRLYGKILTKPDASSGFEHWKAALSLTECAREREDQQKVRERSTTSETDYL